MAILGGGLGGCAAALAAAAAGARVLLTEEHPWLGGQLTSQAVPPDENRWIETHGASASYLKLRHAIREFYRAHYPTHDSGTPFNPGLAKVSRLSCEPRVAWLALQGMLTPWISAGRLTVLTGWKPRAASVSADRVNSVALVSREGEELDIAADYFLDATETGDLLPLTGCEYVTGAESQEETNEPHAVAGPAQPGAHQGFTWCMLLGYDPHGEHVIERPVSYEFWRSFVPQTTPAWTGRLFDWTHPSHLDLSPRRRVLFEADAHQPADALWSYRRILAAAAFDQGFIAEEVTCVNWPQNDYFLGRLYDCPEEERSRSLRESRELSLSWLHWLQTEAPRPDGGEGYPGLRLRPDLTGTDDGLAMAPYIRESRRIRAQFSVTEHHVGADARGSGPAEAFPDSVGIGCYRIDLHPAVGGANTIDVPSLPFQIPLGALLPVRMRNLLPACKNIGTTHITNGCYRLHPIEWNIGEAAGLLAVFCLRHGIEPAAVRHSPERLADYQTWLDRYGIRRSWD